VAAIVLSKIMWDKYRIKKNPHMNILFFKANAAVVGAIVIEVSDNLQLHLEDVFYLKVKVYRKYADGELVLLEENTFDYDRKKPLRFKGFWHQEIEQHMRKLYTQQ